MMPARYRIPAGRTLADIRADRDSSIDAIDALRAQPNAPRIVPSTASRSTVRAAATALGIVLGAAVMAWGVPTSGAGPVLPSAPAGPVQVFEDGSWRVTGCIPGALCDDGYAR